MSILNFEHLGKIISISDDAKRLLEGLEKEISFRLDLRLDRGLICFDSHAVFFNAARGPAKGGIRFAPDVTLEETRVLAELMVYKTALAGIPFGGGKSAICFDPSQYTRGEIDSIVKEYVHMLRDEICTGAYIPAPDMGSGAHEMAIIYGETHNPESVTGKPVEVGGLPGRREATGRGVATVAIAAAGELLSKPIEKTRVAVQGFGNVGSWACRFLSEAGAKVVAVADITGGAYNEDGIDIQNLSQYRQEAGTLAGYGDTSITNEQLLASDVDILIPAACGHVLTGENADQVRAGMIVEGANAPTTKEADEILHTKGIPVLPDILANSGGVIASYVEWRRAKSGSITKIEETYETIDTLILESLESVTKLAKAERASYREAALALAVGHVIKAMEARGWI